MADQSNRSLKVAIVHDWLIGGGAERVVVELHKMFPDAPIYTSYCSDEWRQRLDGKVVTGWLQHFGKLRKFMALGRIWWFGRLDFSGYDLVISSSGNGEAFGVRVPDGTTHICYCHTPTHYYWRNYKQYLAQPGFGIFNPLARLGLRLLVGPLRRWDYKAAQRVDHFIANSSHIQSDIKQFYGRDAVVIHPPIDVARFTAAPASERKGFVSASRLVPAKHIDLLVAACTKLNLPLTVISTGPELTRLKAMAGPTITFTGKISDEEVAHHMGHAEAYLFASFDDFGIVPVEAMAAGTPVIAYKAGGALDYVVPGKTGLFFAEQTVDSLVAALQQFDTKSFNASDIRDHAQQFAPEVFVKKIQTFIDQSVAK
jgi:glycosyltransferase involved in cell wall biosynthesis